jgi:hypothetical protein
MRLGGIRESELEKRARDWRSGPLGKVDRGPNDVRPKGTVIRPRVVKRGKKTDGPRPTKYQERRLIIR